MQNLENLIRNKQKGGTLNGIDTQEIRTQVQNHSLQRVQGKREKAQTILVPSEIPKSRIRQYVMAEAACMERKFRYGIEESDQTKFEDYAQAWISRQVGRYKATTLAGYKRNLETIYPYIGGFPLCKLRPLGLEEMCDELRKRRGKNEESLSEATVQKYLQTISAILADACKNDIIPYNPARRVSKRVCHKTVQKIPQPQEAQRLLQCILQEPLTYQVYYLMAMTTGLRRGELCALRWDCFVNKNMVLVEHSRSVVQGQGVVESDTKNHRRRLIVLPVFIIEKLYALLHEQRSQFGTVYLQDYVFRTANGPIYPDTFSHRLRRIYDQNGFSRQYHLHTMRHFCATYLLEQGTSKQVVANLLGHADTGFLERTYCHPQIPYKQQAANLMDGLLTGKKETAPKEIAG